MSIDDKNPYQSPSNFAEYKPEFEVNANPELAGRLTRLAARLVDGIIGMAVIMPLMFLTGYFQRAMQQQAGLVEMALYTVGGIVLYLVLHGYLLATRGQTIGKYLLDIRIVDYETGRLLPFVKLVGLRDLALGLIGVIPCLGPLVNIVNILFIFGEQRRCLHDLLADTKVVKVINK